MKLTKEEETRMMRKFITRRVGIGEMIGDVAAAAVLVAFGWLVLIVA